MSTDFNWRTDDEQGWDDAPRHSQAGRGTQRRWPRRVFYLALLLLAGVAAVVLYRQVSARVNDTTSEIVADVLSSYEVMQRTAETGDRELFTSILSGRDDTWTDAQRELVEMGLFDRPVFNLDSPAPQTIPAESVTLSDDLQSAEIAVPIQYAVDVGNDVTQTITLIHTHVYRRGDNQRWLYAPPLKEFWGAAENVAATRLNASVPARDAELARRLILDLDRTLAQACRLPDVSCPAAVTLDVTFSADPRTLLDGRNPETGFDQGLAVTLPTPTLVGVPRDEPAYRALLRGYGAQLVRTMLTAAAGASCCDQPLFFQATLDRQLADLGLLPWPLGREEFQLLMRRAAPAAPGISHLAAPFDVQRQGDEWPVAYAMVEYMLRRRGNLTPGALQTMSITPVMLIQYNLDEQRSWLLFLNDRLIELGGAQPQTPPAVRGISLLCVDREQEQVIRYTLDLTTQRPPQVEIALDAAAYLFPLPDKRYVVVDPEAGAALYGPDGIPQPIRGAAVVGQRPLYALDTNAAERLTLIYGGDGNALAVSVSPDKCLAGGCPTEELPGLPRWAPDGKHAITLPLDGTTAPALIDDQGVTLRRIDARTQSVDWIDETTFVMGVEHTLFRSGVRWDNSEPLYDVRDSVPDFATAGFRSVEITHLAAGRDAVFFSAAFYRRGGGPESVLFRYDLATGKVTELDRMAGSHVYLDTSPDGREVLLAGWGSEPLQGDMPIFDYIRWNTTTLTAERWRSARPPWPGPRLWSPNGEWLLFPGAVAHRIVHTPSGEIRLLLTDSAASCYFVEWT